MAAWYKYIKIVLFNIYFTASSDLYVNIAYLDKTTNAKVSTSHVEHNASFVCNLL